MILVDLTCSIYQHDFFYINIHNGWSLAWILMNERVNDKLKVKNLKFDPVKQNNLQSLSGMIWVQTV